MKKLLAFSIFSLLSQPAGAALLCPIIDGPPLPYYGQYSEQCMEITVTAAQELACMATYVAGDPPPPLAAAQVRAFFERGRALVEAVRRGFISNAGARAQLARNMVDVQYRVEAKVEQLLYRCHYRWCNSPGYSTFCNGY